MPEKFNDLTSLASLLSDEEKAKLSEEKKKEKRSKPIGEGLTARVALDKHKRRGKVVTIITGIELSNERLEALAQELRKTCGTGGTFKDRVIELQGDQMARIRQALITRGFTVK